MPSYPRCSRRTPWVTGLVALALLAARPAGADEAPAVDLKLRRVIPVDRWPKAVELTPDGRHAITTNFWANTLSVIEVETGRVIRRIRTGKGSPVEVAFFGDGRRALVTGGWQEDELFVLDLERWAIDRRIPGKTDGPAAERRRFPKVVAFSPDRSRFYVSYWKSDTVAVFDAATLALLGVIPTGRNPRGIAITPDGRKGYACNFDTAGNGLTVFRADEAPFPVQATIPDLPNPRHVAIAPDGRFAYVSLFGGGGGVAKVEVATDRVVARSPPLGARGKTLAVSPDGRWLFLVSFGADTVHVLDAGTLAEVVRKPTGDEPCGLALSADGSTLWTTDWNDDRVRVWDVIVRAPGSPPAPAPADRPAANGDPVAAPAASPAPTGPTAATDAG